MATYSPAEVATIRRAPSLATTIIAGGVVVAMLYFGRDFIVTLSAGLIGGLLLEPFVEMLMRLRMPRYVASALVCSLTLLGIYLAGLGLYLQASGLLTDLPKYSQRITEVVDQGVATVESAENRVAALMPHRKPAVPVAPPSNSGANKKKNAIPASAPALPATPYVQEVRISEESEGILVPYLRQNWNIVGHWFLLTSFVPFIVYFTLSWQDHLRRGYLYLFQGPDRHAAGKAWQGIGEMARAYVVGNFILGMFLTAASGVFFWAIGLPYWPLVAPISGFLSLVPYAGLPMAVLPALAAALPAFNQLAPYAMITTVIGFLHLLALNLLYPKLVGSRVHLNPLAATVGVMFWSVLWGPLGLVFGIPITAGVKAVFDNVPRFQAYARLLGD